MRVAVFGGSGFLGSHVADALSAAGHSVIVFDRAPSEWLRPDQEMMIGDILDGEAVSRAAEGCEAVFNFAGVADLDDADAAPVRSATINIIGNLNVCESCVRHGVNRYVFASSLYVHSRVGGAYRCSKRACEDYIFHYQATRGLRCTILRYGSLYGPRSGMTNGIHRFIHEAMAKGRITYFGNPRALRDYIHVSDAAQASVDILHPRFENRSIVLAGSQSVRVADLFQMISEIVGKPVAFDYVADSGVPHYVTTPYSFDSRIGMKYAPQLHIDLGQGLLMKVEELSIDASTVEE